MISKNRHNETTSNGRFIYVIKPNFVKRVITHNQEDTEISNKHNKDFNGIRYDVHFRNGIGRTTSRAKAKLFSEELSYVVQLHKDDTPWVEVKPKEQQVEYLAFDEGDLYEVDETEYKEEVND